MISLRRTALLCAAGFLGLSCQGREPLQSVDAGTGGTGGDAATGADAPPVVCNSCPGPAPHSTNYLCPDGVTVAGPACTADANGVCGWTTVVCPTTCNQGGGACVQGTHFDSSQCKCVPDQACGPVCLIFCLYGNVLDANGCPTCACNPAPPGACDTCAGPAPSAPTYLCPDGVTIGGPACRANADGTCGWIIVQCPPTCIDTVLCIQGLHWDANLCKCVPDTTDSCACPADQLCVLQIGGPATQNPPAVSCVAPEPSCASNVACDCLPTSEGACKTSSSARTCSCDNGLR